MENMEPIRIAVCALAGAFTACLPACLPGLHVYNVMALFIAGNHALAARGIVLPAHDLAPFLAGMLAAYSILNTIPSVLLAAPDESAFFTVLPGQKYLMQGRGYQAVLLTATGGLAGLMVLLVVMVFAAPRYLPVARAVFAPHLHWILWCVIAFMLLAEWPKGGTRGQGGPRRLWSGWTTPAAGWLTFLLSGLFGFVLFYRPPLPAGMGSQNLMPAFVGLFTLPWLLLNIVSRTEIPPQDTRSPLRLDPGCVAHGTAAGCLGGGFAAFFPVITGGVGGMLAGHAAALRDDRAFLVSQGAAKTVYYAGGLLLFFVPGLHMTRGGGAWMLRGLLQPRPYSDYRAALGSVALAGAAGFLLAAPLARGWLRLMRRCGYRNISLLALAAGLLVVPALTGWHGLAVAGVGGGIGLIPVLFGSRRMNCLGVILLPMACNLSGAGGVVAAWLGLI